MSPLDLSANRALPYALRARVEFRDPENCLRRLCDHMREHGMHVHEDDGVFTVILPDVVGSLSKDGRYVTVEAAAADLEAFYFVKMWLQAEFSELAGHPAPLIEWNEESRNLRFPPSFRTLAVVTVRDITPRMRRITFKGNDLNRFDTLSALHLQLLINLGAVTEQCRRQCDFSDSETLQDAPVWRRYTVRSVDRARGTIDVDFFLHGSSGPGANWARQARPGDLVGVAGPSGGGIAKANWYFLAGDETALPAIARILECLPATARGIATIEVASERERQALTVPSGIAIEWLYRENSSDACPHSLLNALESTVFPALGESRFAWIGCEATLAKKIRAHLRSALAFTKSEQLVVAYWHGHGDEPVRS
jgi:NADPH-dependent ferric siderophore reductase